MTVQATDPRVGPFAFAHHNRPIEYSWNIDERIAAIKRDKPAHEIPERLRCLTYIPIEVLPPAWALLIKTRREADALFNKTREEAWAFCVKPCRETWPPYDETYRAAIALLDKTYREAEALFNKTCEETGEPRDPFQLLLEIALTFVPDAPWDREQGCLVFTRAGEEHDHQTTA